MPDEPSPPDAPSRLIIHELNEPEPTVLVGAAKVNVVPVYEITSHSWKCVVS